MRNVTLPPCCPRGRAHLLLKPVGNGGPWRIHQHCHCLAPPHHGLAPECDALMSFDVGAHSTIENAHFEDHKVRPFPALLNWTKLRGPKRTDVVRQLQADTHPDNLECVMAGRPIEHMSIKAALFELEARFQDANVVMVHPDVTAILGLPGPLPENEGGEVASFIKSIRAAECTYFTIWAEMH